MAARTRLAGLRPWTTRYFNPISRRFAGVLPLFGIVTCPGRTSGATYRTPVNVFRDGDRYVFALTYGADVNWVRNVLAAGTCRLRTRGRDVRLVGPEVFIDRERRLMPQPIRFFLGVMRVSEFLALRPG